VKLNPEEFMGLGDELAQGGFSRKVAGPGAGSGPKGDVYMVGGYKGVSGDFDPEPAMTDSGIHSFASRADVAPVLSEPNVYLGGWQGSEPPRQSFDASEAYSTRNPASRYAGRLAAAERNQEAVAVIKKGEYSGDMSYPYYQEGAPQSGRNPDLFDASWASSRGGRAIDPVWKQIKGGE
jgi:hypothetical protein